MPRLRATINIEAVVEDEETMIDLITILFERQSWVADFDIGGGIVEVEDYE